VLADVAQHQPVELDSWRATAWRFDEGDVPPRGARKCVGVIVAGGGELVTVRWQLVPLLTRNFAGFAADTQGRIGEKSNRTLCGIDVCHGQRVFSSTTGVDPNVLFRSNLAMDPGKPLVTVKVFPYFTMSCEPFVPSFSR
jgi:hypothetical protein